MTNRFARGRAIVICALATVLVLVVGALAGASFAGNGNGKAPGNGNGNGHGKPAQVTGGSSGSAQYQYGPSGKQYGHHKVLLCHNGHTISVAQPAVKAHMRHGDKLGAC